MLGAPRFRLHDVPPALAFLVALAALLHAVAVRWTYPFDLEWIEGGLLVEALRLRQGLPLYVPPSAEFIPSIYPPLYPWLISVVGEPSYAIGRAISALATLAAIAAGVGLVRRERLPWGLALGGAAIYVTCYDDAGTFFDLVRTDALAMGFLALSVWLVRGGTAARVACGGVLLACAFATKQSFAAFGLPLALWLALYRGRGRALLFAGAAALPAAVLVSALEWSSGGWYLTYVAAVPRAHPLVVSRAFPGTAIELWRAAPRVATAAFVALLAAVPRLRRGTRPGEGASFWLLLAVTGFPLTALLRAHFGSFTNALMPGLWILAVGAVIAVGLALGPQPRRWIAWGCAALLCFQVWEGRWEAGRYLPTDDDRQAGERFVGVLADLDGEVFVPFGPWYPRLAGKHPSFTMTALWDLLHPGSPLRDEARVVADAIAQRRFPAVVAPLNRDFGLGLERHYRAAAVIPAGDGPAFETRVGWIVRLGVLWLPQGDPRAAAPGVSRPAE